MLRDVPYAPTAVANLAAHSILDCFISLESARDGGSMIDLFTKLKLILDYSSTLRKLLLKDQRPGQSSTYPRAVHWTTAK